MRKNIILSFSILLTFTATAQTDSTKIKELEEVTVVFNKWEQKLNEVPNKITKINRVQYFGIIHKPLPTCYLNQVPFLCRKAN